MNNVVGFKPTAGLISANGGQPDSIIAIDTLTFSPVIPVSTRADSVGPISRSVVDAAILLTHTAESNVDYVEGLSKDAVRNRRVGVPRQLFAQMALSSPELYAAFNDALDILRRLGVTIVDPADLSHTKELLECKEEGTAILSEFKVSISQPRISNISTNGSDRHQRLFASVETRPYRGSIPQRFDRFQYGTCRTRATNKLH